ncbi:MFS transporter [Paenarthrobacter nitroguajacolicus]|uniref:MFS transporter n=1 Tax=Paenarthrobacter nitroguajacolicus TaxID=211146 RepID=UPI000A828293|nr:MFS transporter [Paenarthrobacter nitroguajacolicus]
MSRTASSDPTLESLNGGQLRTVRRVALASAIGTTVEWYDYFIYATATALVFGKLFFPEFSPAAGTMAAFATFTVGFFIRPLGAVVFGHLGDRIGRKRMLVLSLMMMGVATVGVGLLPTFAAVGIAAPILLLALRMIQGFAVSGEWGGAVLMAVEHAPAHKRGWYGSWPQIGVPAGLVLANLVFIVLTTSLTPEAFLEWGWRVPFLISVVLILIGLYIRLRVEESPVFAKVRQAGAATRLPLAVAFRKYPKAIALGSLATVATTAVGYIISTYSLSYGTQIIGLDRSVMLWAVLVAALIGALGLLFFSRLSDRIGRRPVFLAGAVGQILWAFPFFGLINTASIWGVLVALCVMQLLTYAMYGPIAAMLAELFGTKVRYTGISIAYQIGSILGAGFAPLVATGIFAATGSTVMIALYIIGLSVVSLIAVVLMKETSSDSLEEKLVTEKHSG